MAEKKIEDVLKDRIDRYKKDMPMVWLWNGVSVFSVVAGIVALFCEKYICFYWLIGLAVLCAGIAMLNRYMFDKMTLELMWNTPNKGNDEDKNKKCDDMLIIHLADIQELNKPTPSEDDSEEAKNKQATAKNTNKIDVSPK